jgi:hypothetical protein
MQLWLVGQCREYAPPSIGSRWDFQGCFDSEETAVAACKTSAYFVMPFELNQELPEEPVEVPGGYYPMVSPG